MNETLPAEEAVVETKPSSEPREPFYRKYKLHLSIASALLVVGVGAFSHYKNEKVKEELTKAIGEYQKNLVLVGGEMTHGEIGCSGIISTDCTIENIRLSMLGQEQLSIKKLRLGEVEELESLRGFSEGKEVKAAIDIEIEEVSLPRMLLAQMVADNVSNAFQQSTLEKLGTLNLALEGEIDGSPSKVNAIRIERLLIDNAIMPIEFAMEARDVVSGNPDSMVLERFSLSVRNRAIADVTYESVNSFVQMLKPEEKGIFLKEFGLKPADMADRAKASRSINEAIAKRFENDLEMTPGIVEKEMIRSIIAMLKGEQDEIILKAENKNGHTMAQIQQFLLQSAAMSEAEAKTFMEDKFVIEVKAD